MVTISKNSIFNLTQQVNLYKYNVERNFVILQGQILGNADYEIAKFNRQKSDELETIQTRLDQLLKAKDQISERLDGIRRSRDQLQEVRTALAQAAAAAQAGKRADFDNALLTVNLEAGQSRTDKSNLIGSLSAAGIGARSEVISLPDGNDVILQTRALTTGYTIVLESGEQVTAQSISGSLKIDGVKYDLTALNYVSSNGDEITFESGGNTFTGTVVRGGLGVLNSFFYENLETQSGRDQAVADIRAALKIVDQVAKNLDAAEIEVARGFGTIDINTGATQQEMNDLVLRQREEEKAFNRSLQIRTQVALSSIALAAQTAETQILSMFTEEPQYTNTILDKFGILDKK
jgi:hypothetical protein